MPFTRNLNQSGRPSQEVEHRGGFLAIEISINLGSEFDSKSNFKEILRKFYTDSSVSIYANRRSHKNQSSSPQFHLKRPIQSDSFVDFEEQDLKRKTLAEEILPFRLPFRLPFDSKSFTASIVIPLPPIQCSNLRQLVVMRKISPCSVQAGRPPMAVVQCPEALM